MYQGEVNIRQEQLASFMLTAELLAVEGLTGASADYLAESREVSSCQCCQDFFWGGGSKLCKELM